MTIEGKCLQQKIGNCTGCPIQEIVLIKRRSVSRADEQTLVENVTRNLCPTGQKLQLPTRREPSIW